MDVSKCLSHCPSSLTKLQILQIVQNFCDLPSEECSKLVSLVQSGASGKLPKMLSTDNKKHPLVLAPPTGECYECQSSLVSYHNTNIRVYSMSGFQEATKYTLRCMKCKLFYRYAHYGNKESGFQMYPCKRPYVEANDVVYFDRTLCELQCCLA